MQLLLLLLLLILFFINIIIIAISISIIINISVIVIVVIVVIVVIISELRFICCMQCITFKMYQWFGLKFIICTRTFLSRKRLFPYFKLYTNALVHFKCYILFAIYV